MFKTVTWNTGTAAERFRFKKNKKKNKATSSQALKRVGPPIKVKKAASVRVDRSGGLGYNGIMKIQYKDLKKNDEVKTTQLGTPVTGKLLESPVQGRGLRKTLLIHSNGSEIGMFDEAGSVYAHQVQQVLRDGSWQTVTGHPGKKAWDPDAYLDSITAGEFSV